MGYTTLFNKNTTLMWVFLATRDKDEPIIDFYKLQKLILLNQREVAIAPKRQIFFIRKLLFC